MKYQFERSLPSGFQHTVHISMVPLAQRISKRPVRDVSFSNDILIN